MFDVMDLFYVAGWIVLLLAARLVVAVCRSRSPPAEGNVMDERTRARIRDGLLAAGVGNLKQFGYPGVNKKNIMTDMVFKRFFLSMLESEENATSNANIEAVRRSLIEELTTEPKS